MMSTIPLYPEDSASWEYWKNMRSRTSEPDSVQIPLSSDFLPTNLAELLDKTELSKHEIAMLSGVSPAYLSAFERGLIQKVGREKLMILLMLALNMSLDDTNSILEANGHKRVDELDARPLIEASLRQTVRGLQTIRSNLSLTLLILSTESLPGETVIVYRMPDIALLPLEHSAAVLAVDSSDPVYVRLVEHVHKKRIEMVNDSLQRGDGRYCLMCEHCLRQHLAEYQSDAEPSKEWILDHLRNTIAVLKKYHNFRIDLLNSCQRHWFQMKLMRQKSQENSKVLFAGRTSISAGAVGCVHEPKMERDPDAVWGFATDNKKLYRRFLEDLDRLVRKFIIRVPSDDMPAYLVELVKDVAKVDLF